MLHFEHENALEAVNMSPQIVSLTGVKIVENQIMSQSKLYGQLESQ